MSRSDAEFRVDWRVKIVGVPHAQFTLARKEVDELVDAISKCPTPLPQALHIFAMDLIEFQMRTKEGE